MTALVTVYWLCFATGLIYVIAAGALGAIGHSAGGHGAEVHGGGGESGADTDLDTGDLEAADIETGELDSGGLDAAHGLGGGAHGTEAHATMGHAAHSAHADGHSNDGMMEYNPFSPLSLMGFLCAFGATGLIGTALGLASLINLGLAVGGGLVMALLMWLIIGKLLFGMQGSSEAHQADMIGLEAQVLTPIEEGHLGEIAYILDGVRYTAPAKLLHAGRAGRESDVRIRRIRDNVVYVEEKRKLLN